MLEKSQFHNPKIYYCCYSYSYSLFQVERTDVSLSDPQGPIVRGTRFPGNSYYQFPSDTLPTNSDFTGKKACLDTCTCLCVYQIIHCMSNVFVAIYVRVCVYMYSYNKSLFVGFTGDFLLFSDCTALSLLVTFL